MAFNRGEEESPSNQQAGFYVCRISGVNRKTWCQILFTCSSIKKSSSKPPLTKIQKEKCQAWSVQYLKQDINLALFTDELRATLDGLIGDHVDGVHVVEQHQLSSNNSKVEMA